jgi:hypothetical protein
MWSFEFFRGNSYVCVCVCVRERERERERGAEAERDSAVGIATSAVSGYLRKRAPPLHDKSFPLCRGGRHFFFMCVYFLHCLLGSSSCVVSPVSNAAVVRCVTGKWCSAYVFGVCFMFCELSRISVYPRNWNLFFSELKVVFLSYNWILPSQNNIILDSLSRFFYI